MEIKKSGFQTPLTIKESVESIHERKYLLPAIQREFVWSPEQIVKLFDSLMKEYTIGSFLFWSVGSERVRDFQFYEFVRDYHEKYSRHNPKANVTGKESITAILDGQQRLTTLYIGLKGTYSSKIPRKRWDNDEAFPKRKLYLNLLSESPEFDLTYDFRLLTDSEASERSESFFWFEVGKILEFKELSDVNDFLIEHELNILPKDMARFANRTLFKLFGIIHNERVINYYLETSQELDKVLNIFIRVNSGGTQLSYSDLLLSIATAQWKTRDAREEITAFVDDLNRIGDGFNFDKDFVLKSCLVLSDFSDIAFKVDNFNAANMRKIEDSWDGITKSIRLSVELVNSFGYNRETLTSSNALIPVSYFIRKIDNPLTFVQSSAYKESRDRISKWLAISLIKRSFSGQPDNVLRPIRSIIQTSDGRFPFEQIVDQFKGTNRALSFTDDDLNNLLYYKYGQSYTFAILSLLYPTLDFRNKFHQDHIFPKSFFRRSELRKRNIPDEQRDEFLESCDYLANLQLLEGIPNEEKSNTDFKEWLEEGYPDAEERRDYMKKHLIPLDIDLSFSNFLEFEQERDGLITKKLKEVLRE